MGGDLCVMCAGHWVGKVGGDPVGGSPRGSAAAECHRGHGSDLAVTFRDGLAARWQRSDVWEQPTPLEPPNMAHEVQAMMQAVV